MELKRTDQAFYAKTVKDRAIHHAQTSLKVKDISPIPVSSGNALQKSYGRQYMTEQLIAGKQKSLQQRDASWNQEQQAESEQEAKAGQGIYPERMGAEMSQALLYSHKPDGIEGNQNGSQTVDKTSVSSTKENKVSINSNAAIGRYPTADNLQPFFNHGFTDEYSSQSFGNRTSPMDQMNKSNNWGGKNTWVKKQQKELITGGRHDQAGKNRLKTREYLAAMRKKEVSSEKVSSDQQENRQEKHMDSVGEGTSRYLKNQESDTQKSKGTSNQNAGESKRNDQKAERNGSKKQDKNKKRKNDSRQSPAGISPAAKRLASYLASQLGWEESKDSLLKIAADIIKAKLSKIALGLLTAIAPALFVIIFIMISIMVLYNSPFAILLPPTQAGETVINVIAGYQTDFAEQIAYEKEHLGRAEEAEILYEGFEGDGEPQNFADILMVYMVKYGCGDTATIMNEKSKPKLSQLFQHMTSYQVDYRTEIREEPYEEIDRYGETIILMEEVEVVIKEIHITLLTHQEMADYFNFSETDREVLNYLMSPEVLEKLSGIPLSSYGKMGPTTLTRDQENNLALGNDIGSRAVKKAIEKLGTPYSQSYRDSGNYYDCSSLTYYCYLEVSISLIYRGSNTAAAQAELLASRGCQIAYEDIRPGDLIFYSFTKNGRYLNISHTAIYAGNGYVIDASSSKGYVVFRHIYSVGSIVMCGRPANL